MIRDSHEDGRLPKTVLGSVYGINFDTGGSRKRVTYFRNLEIIRDSYEDGRLPKTVFGSVYGINFGTSGSGGENTERMLTWAGNTFQKSGECTG